MATNAVTFGLTLANRGVLFGATTPAELLQMAQIADESRLYRSVYVGDSILGNPRLESVTLLAAIAARTARVRLGTACMASFPLRDPILLACQWATLDLLAEGRALLVACTGVIGREDDDEARVYGVAARDRPARLVEGIKALKQLWTEDSASFEGDHYRFERVSIGLKGARRPRPAIWIANNARGTPAVIDRALRRVARHADGWQTAILRPPAVETFVERWARIREHAQQLGRDPDAFDNCVYYNINVNEDRERAYDEAKRFLDAYYETNWPRETIEAWVAYGPPEACVEKLRIWADAGAKEVTLRLVSWDQMGQLRRCIEEVLPQVNVETVT